MERLNKMHINYKDWARVSKMAKANGIKTFAELEMYCRVWEIKTGLELICQLGSDYIEVLAEQQKEIYRKGVEMFGNN